MSGPDLTLGPEQRVWSCVRADRKLIRYRSKRPPETELRAKLRDLAKARWASERWSLVEAKPNAHWSPGFVHDQFDRRLRERTIRQGTSLGDQVDDTIQTAASLPQFYL